MSEETNKARSFKNAMTLSFSDLSNLKTEDIDFSNNSVIVITAAGTIYGTACTDLSEENSIDGKVFSTVYNNAVENTNPDIPRYCLVLKDATLISSETFKQNFNILFVFPEDIIAITFGDTSKI